MIVAFWQITEIVCPADYKEACTRIPHRADDCIASYVLGVAVSMHRSRLTVSGNKTRINRLSSRKPLRLGLSTGPGQKWSDSHP